MKNPIAINRSKLVGTLKKAAKHKDFIDTNISTIISLIKEDKNKEYLSLPLSFKNEPRISYAPLPKLKYNEEKRIKSTLGRYIRRRLEIDVNTFSDTNLFKLSEFVDACLLKEFKEKDEINNSITLYIGKDLASKMVDFGTLNKGMAKSCMTGKQREKNLDLYKYNPNKVSLAVYQKDNCIVRAFVWKTDCGKVVHDREYGVYNYFKNFNLWASNNKILARPSLNKEYLITLDYDKKWRLPYLDTFKFAKIEDNDKIVLSNNASFGNITLNRTDGDFTQRILCNYCDMYVEPSNIYDFNNIYNKNYIHLNINGSICRSCINNRFSKCQSCLSFYEKCGKEDVILDIVGLNHINYCSKCRQLKALCVNCKKHTERHNLLFIYPFAVSTYYNGVLVCFDCITNAISLKEKNNGTQDNNI